MAAAVATLLMLAGGLPPARAPNAGDPPLPCPCGDARLCGPLGAKASAALAARLAWGVWLSICWQLFSLALPPFTM